MKTKLFLFILLTFIGYSYAQIGFEEHIIQENANGPYSVYTADINNDGYMDIISCSIWGDKVFWHENKGGQGDFETHIIEEFMNGAVSVYAADFNGDEYMDVLSGSVSGDTAWYENIDGGTDWVKHIITANVDGSVQVHAADIDNDGDMDALSVSEDDDTIAWYENTDGQGNFEMHEISTSQNGSRSVYTADINEDGFIDVLAASYLDGKVVWYKNLGNGDFGDELIIATYTNAWRVTASDLNGDGHMDVIALLDDYKIDWYENDAQGNFVVHKISRFADGGEGVYAEDMDDDGDNDVLCATFFDHKISWHENLDGQGTDWKEHIIQEDVTNASSVHAADINNDGKMDVIATGRAYGKVVWFEQVILGISENTLVGFSVYPNPTTNILNVEAASVISYIEVFNVLGQILYAETTTTNKTQIDISAFQAGNYFVRVTVDNNTNVLQIIKK